MTISDCPTACMPLVVKHQHFLFTSAPRENMDQQSTTAKKMPQFHCRTTALARIGFTARIVVLSVTQITSYICYCEGKHIQNKSSSIIPSLQWREEPEHYSSQSDLGINTTEQTFSSFCIQMKGQDLNVNEGAWEQARLLAVCTMILTAKPISNSGISLNMERWMSSVSVRPHCVVLLHRDVNNATCSELHFLRILSCWNKTCAYITFLYMCKTLYCNLRDAERFINNLLIQNCPSQCLHHVSIQQRSAEELAWEAIHSLLTPSSAQEQNTKGQKKCTGEWSLCIIMGSHLLFQERDDRGISGATKGKCVIKYSVL